MEKLLEVENLSVSYFTYAGEVQSVRGISFDVKKGKTTALVGESGCGKSVTAKSLMGLIEKPGKVKPESKIIYQGKELTGYTEKEWNTFRGKECSMVFQDALVSLNPTMKVGKQIAENLKNHESSLSKEEIYQKSLEMLKQTGVPDPEGCMNKYPHELSGGMRQRVMIACAMVTHPQLLIADEPTTALDVTIQAQIIALMEELQEKLGMSIIIITHDLGVVADMADEIIVMYAGEIVERGTCSAADRKIPNRPLRSCSSASGVAPSMPETLSNIASVNCSAVIVGCCTSCPLVNSVNIFSATFLLMASCSAYSWSSRFPWQAPVG